jgi:hypothetical protein
MLIFPPCASTSLLTLEDLVHEEGPRIARQLGENILDGSLKLRRGGRGSVLLQDDQAWVQFDPPHEFAEVLRVVSDQHKVVVDAPVTDALVRRSQ